MSARLLQRQTSFGLLLGRKVPSSPWWRRVRAGLAPKPAKLGPGVTAWKVADLRDWLSQAEAV